MSFELAARGGGAGWWSVLVLTGFLFLPSNLEASMGDRQEGQGQVSKAKPSPPKVTNRSSSPRSSSRSSNSRANRSSSNRSSRSSARAAERSRSGASRQTPVLQQRVVTPPAPRSSETGPGTRNVRPSYSDGPRESPILPKPKPQLPIASGATPSTSSGSQSGTRHRGGHHRSHYHYPGCGHHYGYGGYGYGGYGYGGYGYGGYGGFGYGYGYPGYPGYYGGYGGYGYHHPPIYIGRGRHEREGMGALDLNIKPKKTQIFINGEIAGVADQYDGYPGYLWLDEGTYDIVFYLEGHSTISRQYSVYSGVVMDVNDRMVPGEAKKPEDLISRSTVNRDERLRRDRERVESTERRGETREPGDVGRLGLSIWPEDTAVYLDGHFLGTAGELAQLSAGLVVEPGEHLLELVRPGFITEEVPVTVEKGEKIDLELELKER